MHVLQLLPALEVGGVERGVVDLAKGLIARGHRVSVASSGGPLVERLIALGAMHYEMPLHDKSPQAVLACIPALTQLIRTTEVDLVHARSRVPAWIGWVAARRTQRPFVTTAHGFYRPHLGSRVMAWGRIVIAPSEELGAYLADQLGVSRSRLRVIPRGVDLDEFAFQPPAQHEGPWRIGLIGRVSPIKGQAVAIRAMAQLRRRGLPVALMLAGDTPDAAAARASLESLIGELGIQDAVKWLGIRQDVAALIASMDLIVMPSTYPESFGRSAIEAQAVGRPVVASRIGALAGLIQDGETGLLVPPNDPQALARAIERLIQEPALRAQCIERGRAQVEARWSAARMVEQTLQVYDECLAQPRILIWKLSALGDVILSVPTLRAIRRQFPKAQITLAVGRSAYELVARCPYVDDVMIFDPKRKDRGVRRQLSFLRRLRAGRFDCSLDLQNSRRTHLFAWLAGIPVRAGYRRKFGWLLNRGVRLPRVVLTPIAHQHYLLREAGFTPDGDELELWPSARDENAVAHLLGASDERPLVGVHPGGSGRWKTKRWDVARWARVCNELAKRHVRVVMVGGSEEQALGEQLSALTNPPPLNAIGRTSLLELACLIKRCAVFLAHDSSTLHLAAAVGTPTVALFGPTDPQRHLPPNFRGTVIKKDVFCSPCYSPHCRTITHQCMKRITVDEVMQQIVGLLADAA